MRSRRLTKVYLILALSVSVFLIHPKNAISSPSEPNQELSSSTLSVPVIRTEDTTRLTPFSSDSFSSTTTSWYERIHQVFQKLYPQYNGEFSPRDTDSLVCINNGSWEKFGPPLMEEVTQLSFLPEHANYEQQHIQISILEHAFPNAYALPKSTVANTPPQIFISIGLLELVHDESELAFILAHEMAHLRFGHFSPHVPSLILGAKQLAHIALIHQAWEHAADDEALLMLTSAGYSPQAALSLLSRLAHLDRMTLGQSASFTRRHPAIEQRLSALSYRLGVGFKQTARLEPKENNSKSQF